jgi:hypothetical protein
MGFEDMKKSRNMSVNSIKRVESKLYAHLEQGHKCNYTELILDTNYSRMSPFQRSCYSKIQKITSPERKIPFLGSKSRMPVMLLSNPSERQGLIINPSEGGFEKHKKPINSSFSNPRGNQWISFDIRFERK